MPVDVDSVPIALSVLRFFGMNAWAVVVLVSCFFTASYTYVVLTTLRDFLTIVVMRVLLFAVNLKLTGTTTGGASQSPLGLKIVGFLTRRVWYVAVDDDEGEPVDTLKLGLGAMLRVYLSRNLRTLHSVINAVSQLFRLGSAVSSKGFVGSMTSLNVPAMMASAMGRSGKAATGAPAAVPTGAGGPASSVKKSKRRR